MSTIGSINIRMTADVEKFKKDLAKGADSLKGFVARGIGPVNAALGALAGALSVAGAATLITSTIQSLDDLGESAQRIGTTTEALSSLRYAAQLSGSDAGALDGALQKLNANLSDAAGKGGPAADALKKMGLSAKDLITQDPAEAFKKISGGMAALKNPADRAAMSMDLFGKSGQALLNTLNAGPEQLAKLTAEAKGLGVALSDADAAKVGEAADALDKMKAVAGGIANQLTVSLAPAVVGIADGFAGLAPAIGTGIGLLGDFATGIGESFAAAAEIVSGWVGDFGTATDTVGGFVDNLGYAFRNLPDFMAIAALKIEEKVINIGEYFAVIPKNLAIIGEYIANNWSQLVIDGVNAVLAAFHNLGTNIGNLAFSVFEFLKDPTGGFHFEWTPLLDGFKATAAKFPDLLAPELTSMQADIDAKFAHIGERELKRAEDAKKALDLPDRKPFELGDKDDKKAKEIKHAGAFELGSKEAYSAILSADGLRGGKEDDSKATAKNTAKHVSIATRQTQLLQQIADTGGIGAFKLGA